MNIELIYTPFEGEQYFDYFSINTNQLESEETLKKFVTRPLTEEQKEILCKVSCCLDGGTEMSIDELKKLAPEWFMNCNGKLWFNDHKRAQYGLD